MESVIILSSKGYILLAVNSVVDRVFVMMLRCNLLCFDGSAPLYAKFPYNS